MTEPNPCYAHLIAAMERHGLNTPRHRPAKSYIVQGTIPANGNHFEQRVRGTPTECIAWAASEGLIGRDFKVSPDIYGESYSRNW